MNRKTKDFLYQIYQNIHEAQKLANQLYLKENKEIKKRYFIAAHVADYFLTQVDFKSLDRYIAEKGKN